MSGCAAWMVPTVAPRPTTLSSKAIKRDYTLRKRIKTGQLFVRLRDSAAATDDIIKRHKELKRAGALSMVEDNALEPLLSNEIVRVRQTHS
ncbi:TPA: hypothetical protein N0F65_000865 [Lagenidium giganteum]|uniref:Uncharacterized protein n=1 Tax=Lagenidium giganteum TaxID=4803 RepID=A0AAV2YKU0_9STRA|nr:TPA: hypothetical protein N0F65_000865 [Lagenidium giganteum]